MTGERNLACYTYAFVDYKNPFDKVNTVKLLEILHNDREPQQILTSMFNNHENDIISMKINNETDRMETYQTSSSTRIWHIAFVLHNSHKISYKSLETSTYLFAVVDKI